MSRPILSRLAVAANRVQFSRICGLPPHRSPSLITRNRTPSALQSIIFRRSLIAAPKEGGPPLLQRSANRELPDVTPKRRYLIHIPIFLISMYIAANLLFNYQRSSSSVVSSTLYALRVNPDAREILGDEISFKAKTIPWIHGTMDQLHGKIDISYKVRGSKGEGTVHFLSVREGGEGGEVQN
ncbi:hypothetical protein TWF281_003944 [Arthrobotrys megalospora]